MRQYRCETLIVELDRNLWHCLPPTVDKLLYALEVLTRLTIGLTRLANDDTLHFLTGYICLQIFKELRSSDSRQPSRYHLERIGDCQTRTFLSVIYR